MNRRNVLNNTLRPCSGYTGWRRDGFCSNDNSDPGTHIVCAIVTKKFLDFTRSRGNDLTTPQVNFPGLKPGDRWCLCVGRWIEAFRAGVAPPVVLEATDRSVLQYVPFHVLRRFAIK